MPDRYDANPVNNSAWPEMVSIDVTSKCNLRCVHCYNDSSDARECDMSRELLAEAGRQIGELRPFNVCLCGGEPLCRGEALFGIIDALRPNVARIAMVSNGWAMTENTAQRLVQHGVDAIQISLDGAFAWQHDSIRGVCGSFDRAVNAIKLLNGAGMKQVTVAILPNKLNLSSFEEYANLCRSLGVRLIRTMPFIPSGRGRTVGRALMLDDAEYFALNREIARLNYINAGSVEIEWDDPLSHLIFMPKRAMKGRNSIDIEIRSNGRLAVSTYLPITVGDIGEHTLKEYWQRGYQFVWGDERLRSLCEPVKNIYDLEEFEPKPYSGKTIILDIWREEP